MILVGICGMMGSGKSTFAELLKAVDPERSLHLETSTVISELGNTFNAVLKGHLTDLSTTDDHTSLANSLILSLQPRLSIMAGQKLMPDQLIIDLHDMHQHPEWYEKLFLYLKQVTEHPELVSETITAENKANYRALLQWIGGYFLYKLNNRLLWYEELVRRAKAAGNNIRLVALTAPRQPSEAKFVQAAGGVVIKIERPGLDTDTTDVTERRVIEIMADSIIVNEGSLSDLQQIAQHVYSDIQSGNLKDRYTVRGLAGHAPQA